MKYYFGGYYLIKPRKNKLGGIFFREVLTCSSCINDSLCGSWTFSWTTPSDHEIDYLRNELLIDLNIQKKIQKWADDKFDKRIIGWPDVFSDLSTIREYSEMFFSHLENRMILKVVFSESETTSFLSSFRNEDSEIGTPGLYNNLSMKLEANLEKYEKFIGYDLIGIEYGDGFHTFHCHNIENELKSSYGIKLNNYGLIDKTDNLDEIIKDFNDERAGVEPVPWFWVKVLKVGSLE